MPALSEAIHCLLRGLAEPSREPDLPGWQRRLGALAEAWPDSAARALVAGANAHCVAFAFAAGYQAALDRLLGPSPGAPFRALCVTEGGGNRPRDIHTTLRHTGAGWQLDGEKTWVTGGAQAALLCVAARLDTPDSTRPQLRMVCIPSARAGVEIRELAPLPYVTELPHTALALRAVAVADHEILPGDGYTDAVKPFRTLEDIHVELALLGLLVRRLRDLAGREATIERLLAAIATLFAASRLEPLDPAAHLLLAGNRAAVLEALATLEHAWEQADPEFHANWQRDRRLLGVAQGARAARTARAWEDFRGTPLADA